MIDHAFAGELIGCYGSPVYVYDAAEVEQRARELEAALPRGVRLFYSLKANPLPGLIRLLSACGLDADVSSVGELRAASAAGISGTRLLFGGPGKSGADIEHAVSSGVRTFSCESALDLERVHRAAQASRAPVAVLLRLNPESSASAGLAMSGISSQFGVDEDTLARLLSSGGSASTGTAPTGLHVYYGTQMRSAAAIVAACEHTLAAASRLAARTGRSFDVVNFGGGFPWPFACRRSPPVLTGLREGLESVFTRAAFRGAAWFESGRYLAASSGTLLTTVLDIKESKGRHYVVVDAGINHLAGMSALGRIHLPRVELAPLDTPSGRSGPSSPTFRGHVVGPLCTPLDVLARDLELADLRPGDVLAVPNVGAYAATASLVSFLSRAPAAEVIHRGCRVEAAFQLRSGHARLAPASSVRTPVREVS